MSKFPDGTILMYKLDKKAISVEVATAKLIKCKNCAFHSMFHDKEIKKTYDYCDEYSVKTNPEGYCWRAVRKDVLDG